MTRSGSPSPAVRERGLGGEGHLETVSLEYYSWIATQLKGVGERGTTERLPIDGTTTVRLQCRVGTSRLE